MRDPIESLAWEWNSDEDEWSWSSVAEIKPGHRIDLFVDAGNDLAELRVAVAQATAAWERLCASEPRVRAVVAGQITEIHNDHCDPADKVTEGQFTSRLRLKSAFFEPAGGAPWSTPPVTSPTSPVGVGAAVGSTCMSHRMGP